MLHAALYAFVVAGYMFPNVAGYESITTADGLLHFTSLPLHLLSLCPLIL